MPKRTMRRTLILPLGAIRLMARDACENAEQKSNFGVSVTTGTRGGRSAVIANR